MSFRANPHLFSFSVHFRVNSPDFTDAEVEVSVRDLQDVGGYSIMTIGYPLTVEFTGPGMEMDPLGA